MSASENSRLIRVGRIAGAFGVKGEVRINAFTETPEALLKYKTLLRDDGSPGLTLSSGRVQKGAVIARAEEIPTREAAEALKGVFLNIPRERLPEPEEEEFYIADLVGLAAVAPDGAPMGVVRAVRDFGAGDILEIKPENGHAWLIAFTKENAPEIRLAAGEIVIVKPDEVSERD